MSLRAFPPLPDRLGERFGLASVEAMATLASWRLLIPQRASDLARETAAHLDPLTLRFRSDELERSFQRWYDRASRPLIRLALGLGALLYLAFYLLDLRLLPELAVPVLWIRLTVVLPRSRVSR